MRHDPRMARRRRRRGEGSVFFSHSERRWIARVSLGVRDGHRIRHRISALTQDEAKQSLEKLQRIYGRGGRPSRSTLDEYLADWLEWHGPSVRPRTLTSYRGHVERHISPLLGGIRVLRLAPADVRRLIADRLAAGLSPSTVGRIITTLRIGLNAGIAEGMLADNPARLVRLPRVEREPVLAMTVRDARAILAAVRGDRFEALYVLLLGSGLRLGEALSLDWRDVDLDRATVRVRHGKTARSIRTVPLPGFAAVALRVQQRRARRYGPDEPVFLGPRRSERLRGDSVLHHWKILRAAHGLRPMRLHDLRHAHATLLLAAGVPMRLIADQLGHASPAITANIYAHVASEHLRAAIATLDAIPEDRESAIGSASG